MTPRQMNIASSVFTTVLSFLMSPLIRPLWKDFIVQLLQYLYRAITGEEMPHNPGLAKAEKDERTGASA